MRASVRTYVGHVRYVGGVCVREEGSERTTQDRPRLSHTIPAAGDQACHAVRPRGMEDGAPPHVPRVTVLSNRLWCEGGGKRAPGGEEYLKPPVFFFASCPSCPQRFSSPKPERIPPIQEHRPNTNTSSHSGTLSPSNQHVSLVSPSAPLWVVGRVINPRIVPPVHAVPPPGRQIRPLPLSSAAGPLLTSIPSTQRLHLLLLQLLRWHLLLRLLQGKMTTQRSRFLPCS